MPKYIITMHKSHEIEAVDEDDARQKFWDTVIYDTQSDPATFIEENLRITEKKLIKRQRHKCEITGCDNFTTARHAYCNEHIKQWEDGIEPSSPAMCPECGSKATWSNSSGELQCDNCGYSETK